MYHPFQLDGAELHMADMTIELNAALAGQAVGAVQERHVVNLIMHRTSRGVDVNPVHEVVLAPGDTVLVIAPMERLVELEAANRGSATDRARAPEVI